MLFGSQVCIFFNWPKILSFNSVYGDTFIYVWCTNYKCHKVCFPSP